MNVNTKKIKQAFNRRKCMTKNILISATRQWNPGDEFIMFGVENIIKEMIGPFNPILYNRSPEVRNGRKYNQYFKTKNKALRIEKMHLLRLFKGGFRDNSFKNGTDESIIDCVVFAGSPEWYGYRVKSLYEIVKRRKLPCAFLGIGMGDSRDFNKLEKLYYEVLDKADVISTRDHQTLEYVSKYGAKYVTCPAFLSAPYNKKVEKVQKVALIYATNKTVFGNNVSKETHDYLIGLYKELAKIYDVTLVCHYIDEIEEARKELPEFDIRYSYDAKDYIDIYNEFDMVVGGRVHGIGICGSLGIPGVMISHDVRSETVRGFKAEVINYKEDASYENAIKIIRKVENEIEERSKILIEHKENVKKEYIELLRPMLERI